MAIHRYWRLTGFATAGNTALELSEARIYEGGVLADASATLTATFAPTSGAVADLRDGVATGVVSWLYASYSAPGFALVWDFGVGLGVEFPALRLGAGNDASTYPVDLTPQYSSDGINWTTYAVIISALYPGALTLSSVTSETNINRYWSNTPVALHLDGSNGSTVFTDEKGNSIVGTGATISTAQSAFAGGSSLYCSGSSYLTLPAIPISSAEDYTVSFFFFATAYPNDAEMFTTGSTGTPGLQIHNSKLCYGWYIDGTTTVTLNAWHHAAMARFGGVTKWFLGGVLQGSYTNTQEFGTTIRLGGGNGRFVGYIDDFLWVKGQALYTTAFTPPTAPFSTAEFLTSTVPGKRTRQSAPTPQRMLPAIAPPDGAARSHLRETPFFDAQFGGTGTIIGTVKEKALPVNTPLHRRVLLMDQRSQVVFRETWSDAVTGAYTFHGVKTGVPYTVLAYDYTGQYRAVIADNILATP